MGIGVILPQDPVHQGKALATLFPIHGLQGPKAFYGVAQSIPPDAVLPLQIGAQGFQIQIRLLQPPQHPGARSLFPRLRQQAKQPCGQIGLM